MKKIDHQISKIRLGSQKIEASDLKTAAEVVSWMGAVQAQDFAMAKWAIGLRLSEPSQSEIELAIDKGDIIRLHTLRPTWHFVSSKDIYWLINLTAPKIKSVLKTRHKQLEFTENILSRTARILEKNLADKNSLTRDEISLEFKNAGIRTDENRLSHILVCAELEGIICSGPSKGNKITYALLSERVPEKQNFTREQSLSILAKKYFTSHYPATIKDFAWWSNLNLSEIRTAIELNRNELQQETIGSVKYIIPHSMPEVLVKNPSVHLLPAFDEYLVSYKDRSSSLSSVHNRKAVSVNGIFYPPIIVNGQVAGLWKRSFEKDTVIIGISCFNPYSNQIKKLIEKKAAKFGKFLGKDAEVKFTSSQK